jgi:hypothetical protein
MGCLGVGVDMADGVQLEAGERWVENGCVGDAVIRCGAAIAGARESVRSAVRLELELPERAGSLRNGVGGVVGCATVCQVLTGEGAATDPRLASLGLLLLPNDRPLTSS